MATTKNGRHRERLRGNPNMDLLHRARDKSRAEAPRKANGKTYNKYKFAKLMNAEYGAVKTYGGMSKEFRLPGALRSELVQKQIMKYLREGLPYTTECAYAGVKVPVFLQTLEKGKAGFSKVHRKFYRRVLKAQAAGEIRAFRDLKKHRSSDWRVNAWHLERVWPEKYGRVDRIRAENRTTIAVTTESKKELADKVLIDDTARELARRLIDGSAQLHFNEALPAPEKVDA